MKVLSVWEIAGGVCRNEDGGLGGSLWVVQRVRSDKNVTFLRMGSMGLGINVYFSLNGLHSTQIGLCECVCSFVRGFLNVIGIHPTT